MTVDKASKKESSRDTFDTSAVTVGVKVMHKKFGVGEVCSVDSRSKYVRVKFSVGEKLFVMPDCFEQGFLTLTE